MHVPSCMSLTLLASLVLGAPGTQAKPAPAQIRIRTDVYTVRQGAKPEISGAQWYMRDSHDHTWSIYTATPRSLEQAVSRLTRAEAARKVTAPVVLTLDGQMAQISTSGVTGAFAMSFTPTVLSDGLRLAVRVAQGEGSAPGTKATEAEWLIDETLTLKTGWGAALLMTPRGRQGAQTLYVVRAERIAQP